MHVNNDLSHKLEFFEFEILYILGYTKIKNLVYFEDLKVFIFRSTHLIFV